MLIFHEKSAAAKLGVFAVQREEFLMVTAFHDPFLVQHKDLIGVLNCGEAMSDHEARSTGQ